MILQLKNITRVYDKGVRTEALKGIDLSVNKGEFIGIMGASGSGKTTLLNIISTIDAPSSGQVLINGQNPYGANKNDLAQFRRRELGIVFQSYNLLDSLNISENMALPMILEREKPSLIESRVKDLANLLGISDNLNKKPYQVSGGEAQRAAIGRAVINNPSLLLADEPTGNLDTKSSDDVMGLISKLNKEKEVTTLLVTHDPQAASYCSRVIFIKDGLLHNEIYRGSSQKQFFNEILDTLSFLNSNQ